RCSFTRREMAEVDLRLSPPPRRPGRKLYELVILLVVFAVLLVFHLLLLELFGFLFQLHLLLGPAGPAGIAIRGGELLQDGPDLLEFLRALRPFVAGPGTEALDPGLRSLQPGLPEYLPDG